MVIGMFKNLVTEIFVFFNFEPNFFRSRLTRTVFARLLLARLDTGMTAVFIWRWTKSPSKTRAIRTRVFRITRENDTLFKLALGRNNPCRVCPRADTRFEAYPSGIACKPASRVRVTRSGSPHPPRAYNQHYFFLFLSRLYTRTNLYV